MRNLVISFLPPFPPLSLLSPSLPPPSPPPPSLPLQGVDNEVEETIHESLQSLHESLEAVTCLAGQLSLARRMQDRVIWEQTRPQREGVGLDDSINEDFLSVQVSLIVS